LIHKINFIQVIKILKKLHKTLQLIHMLISMLFKKKAAEFSRLFRNDYTRNWQQLIFMLFVLVCKQNLEAKYMYKSFRLWNSLNKL